MELTNALTRRPQERGLATKSKLLSAALSEFRRVGFAEAQIDNITRAVGVSRGTFYFHFPTKEHVLLEVQRRREADILRRFGSEGRSPRPVREFIYRTVDAVMAEAREQADPDLMKEILALHVRRPVGDSMREPLVQAVTSFFDRAGERGEIRRDIPAAELARAFFNAVFGLLMQLSERPAAPAAELRAAFEVFLRGLSP